MSMRAWAPWNWGKKSIPVKMESGDPREAPERRLRDFFADFWKDFDIRPWTWSEGEALSGFSPRVNVVENEDEVTVSAEIPGVAQSDVEVVLGEGVLNIKGEKKREKRGEKDGVLYNECSYGEFRRRIPLGSDIRADGVEATFKDGLLTVRLPKSAKARELAKKVEIKKL